MNRLLPLLGLSLLLVCAVGCRRAPGDSDYETDGGYGDDGGAEVEEDSGPAPQDSGPPPTPDAGPPVVVDAGYEPIDSGPPEEEEDAGTEPVTADAGTFPGEPGVASRISFTQGPPDWEVPAGFCTGQLATSGALRVAVVDGPGDEVEVSGDTYIGLFTDVPEPDDVRWYTNSTCLNNNSVQSVTVPAGQSGVNVHIKISAPGSWILRAVPGGAGGLTEGTQEIYVTEN